MNPIDWAKDHPALAGLSVFAGGAVLLLLLRGKSAPGAPAAPTTVNSGYNASVIAANAQLGTVQAAAQAHAYDTQAALQATLGSQSTALGIAQLNAQTQQAGMTTAEAIADNQNQSVLSLAQIASNQATSLAGLANANSNNLASIAASSAAWQSTIGEDQTLRLAQLQAAAGLQSQGMTQSATLKLAGVA